jgi:hypothetical protein
MYAGIVSYYLFTLTSINLLISTPPAVTLIGAHSVGHTHLENSGYGFTDLGSSLDPVLLNAWDSTPAALDNGYFIKLTDIVRPLNSATRATASTVLALPRRVLRRLTFPSKSHPPYPPLTPHSSLLTRRAGRLNAR